MSLKHTFGYYFIENLIPLFFRHHAIHLLNHKLIHILAISLIQYNQHS
nr:MAG TPA: hypothetical protein [Caudoviricetes sp.]